jgi:hypothetical protein
VAPAVRARYAKEQRQSCGKSGTAAVSLRKQGGSFDRGWRSGGTKLPLLVTCDGTVTGFCLANPKLAGERQQARQMLERQPQTAWRWARSPSRTRAFGPGHRGVPRQPRPGTYPAPPGPQGREGPRYCPNWLRQQVAAINWTLKNQFGLERHDGRVPAGLWAGEVQRLLALNAVIWHDWDIGAPVRRSLLEGDH